MKESPKFLFICGKICSGKTKQGRILAEGLRNRFVDISTIVKDITHQTSRGKLQGRPELDVQIIQELLQYPEGTVVSGVRQVSILEAFPSSSFLWLQVPDSVRLERYLNRKDVKDNATIPSFKQADLKDEELGLSDVKDYIFKL